MPIARSCFALLIATLSTIAAASPPPQEQVNRIPNDVFALSFYLMLPDAFARRCETAHPDDVLKVRATYLAWLGSQMEMSQRVDKARTPFATALAKSQNRSLTAFDADLKDKISNGLLGDMFGNMSPEETATLCADVQMAMHRLLQEDFATEKLMPALENLESLRERASSSSAAPKNGRGAASSPR